ncbi:MAG: DUF2076 domain-containing protein [Acidobacteriaceae bacterium]
MTPQEAQMLDDLVRKVEGTQLTEKDPDAEALLKDGLARDPDAIYKLAQTVLIQNLALEQAHAQMQRMQQQLAPPPQQPPARATSFLGGLLHHNAPQAAPPSGQWQNVPQYPQGAPPNYPPPPAYAGGYASGGGGGFLRSAATTAAGVAGGMLAFQGVESLLHGGFGGGYGGFGGGMPVEETVVNNYYGDPSQQGADPNAIPGPDKQPQGPYEAGTQDQGDAQGYLDDSGASDMGGQDNGQDDGQDAGQDYADDSGGGDFGGGGDDGGDLV